MHRDAQSAQTATESGSWNDLLSRAVVCLGCVVAGGTLVALATPTLHHAAGAASSRSNQTLPETVLLDFTATWCAPCQQMSPIVDRLADQGYPVRKVDVDRERAVAERFGINAMPTFVLLVNGREVMRQAGVTSEAQLRRMVQQIPEWERELAAQSRQRQPETKVADNGSGIAVDLGNSQPKMNDSIALIPTTPKPGVEKSKPPRFGLPFFQRQKDKDQDKLANSAPVFRGQSLDGDRAAAVTADAILAASVRLRVKDQTGMNFGSGTILCVRQGEAVILTCGHIFRNIDKDGIVEVDVFDADRQSEMSIGKVIKFDLASDVGLVSIKTSAALPTVALAGLDRPLETGVKVVSIGCGGGEMPSREELAVTSINRYDGPDNIECTGLPIQGRSGGGLFRGNEVVGVCIAADREHERGVYTALKPIYALIHAAGYQHVLNSAPTTENIAVVNTTPAPKSVPLPTSPDPFGSSIAEAAESAGVMPTTVDPLQDALQQAPDAEVIVIVRPKMPGASSRVVVVNQASSKLMSYLMDDMQGTQPGVSDPALARAEALIPTTVTTPAAPRRPPVNPR